MFPTILEDFLDNSARSDKLRKDVEYVNRISTLMIAALLMTATVFTYYSFF